MGKGGGHKTPPQLMQAQRHTLPQQRATVQRVKLCTYQTIRTPRVIMTDVLRTELGRGANYLNH